MAVKTYFSTEEFIHLLSQYDLGVFKLAAPVAQGTVQTNYFINTSRGKYVFRYYETRSRESVLFECDLLAYLNDRRFPCPAPVADKEGGFVNEYGGKPFVIFTYLQGTAVEQPQWLHKRLLIEQVAALANLTKGYRPAYLDRRWNYNRDLCRRLAADEARRLGTDEAVRKLAWLEHQLTLLELPETLPMGVCHCDFHFANILYLDGQLSGLIDFDDANYTYLLFDLAALIDGWAWARSSDRPDFAQAGQIVQLYDRVRPLSALERRHIFDVHKLIILFDCIWYFERGPADDFRERHKIEYLNALGREEYTNRLQ